MHHYGKYLAHKVPFLVLVWILSYLSLRFNSFVFAFKVTKRKMLFRDVIIMGNIILANSAEIFSYLSLQLTVSYGLCDETELTRHLFCLDYLILHERRVPLRKLGFPHPADPRYFDIYCRKCVWRHVHSLGFQTPCHSTVDVPFECHSAYYCV